MEKFLSKFGGPLLKKNVFLITFLKAPLCFFKGHTAGIQDATFPCRVPNEMTAHFPSEFPLNDFAPQPPSEPGLCHNRRVVYVPHSEFTAALLCVVHALAAKNIQTLEVVGLLLGKVPFSFSIQLVKSLNKLMGGNGCGEVLDILCDGLRNGAREMTSYWTNHLENIIPDQNIGLKSTMAKR